MNHCSEVLHVSYETFLHSFLELFSGRHALRISLILLAVDLYTSCLKSNRFKARRFPSRSNSVSQDFVRIFDSQRQWILGRAYFKTICKRIDRFVVL